MNKIFIFLICSFLGINASEEPLSRGYSYLFFSANPCFKSVVLKLEERDGENTKISDGIFKLNNQESLNLEPLDLDKICSQPNSKVVLVGGAFIMKINKIGNMSNPQFFNTECNIELNRNQGASVVAYLGAIKKITGPKFNAQTSGIDIDTIEVEKVVIEIKPLLIESNE
jgi:hypothetical protein